MTDKIAKFPTRHKPEIPKERVLIPVTRTKCFHGQYLVDEKSDTVECGKCGERLNPMIVLKYLACEETREYEARLRISTALKDIRAQSKWKCGHCGRFNDMTRPVRIRGVK